MTGSSSSSDSAVVRALSPAITLFSVPFRRLGLVEFGGRSTAIKLASGELWLGASTPLDGPTKAGLAQLGNNVKYIVAYDIEHTMFLVDYAIAYPEALVLGPEGLADKFKDEKRLKVAGEYTTNGLAGPTERFGFEDEIESCFFKSHMNKDIAFLHKPSKTLIEADLLMNLPSTEQKADGSLWSKVTSLVAPGSLASQWGMKAIGMKDSAAYEHAASIVSGWDFDRIIPCHGAVIESGGKHAWDSTFQKVLESGRARQAK